MFFQISITTFVNIHEYLNPMLIYEELSEFRIV